MKNMAIFVCFIMLTSTFVFLDSNWLYADTKHLVEESSWYQQNDIAIKEEKSTEELYRDIYVTLLHPCIKKAIDGYYGVSLAYDPWNIEVLDIKRPNGYRTPGFVVELKVIPYLGPHIEFGEDIITISIDSAGQAEVENFRHIKSFEITEYLK